MSFVYEKYMCNHNYAADAFFFGVTKSYVAMWTATDILNQSSGR